MLYVIAALIGVAIFLDLILFVEIKTMNLDINVSKEISSDMYKQTIIQQDDILKHVNHVIDTAGEVLETSKSTTDLCNELIAFLKEEREFEIDYEDVGSTKGEDEE